MISATDFLFLMLVCDTLFMNNAAVGLCIADDSDIAWLCNTLAMACMHKSGVKNKRGIVFFVDTVRCECSKNIIEKLQKLNLVLVVSLREALAECWLVIKL